MTLVRNEPRISIRHLSIGLIALLTGLYSIAIFSEAAFGQVQAPISYPSQGQTLEQQSKDEAECRIWAQQQTGFNPAGGPQYAQQSSSGGQVIGGAAKGAALGAVGGAIAGDAGKGAAVGAGVGATAGLLGRRRDKRQADDAKRQAESQYNTQLAGYYRAFGACMGGRGYTVN